MTQSLRIATGKTFFVGLISGLAGGVVLSMLTIYIVNTKMGHNTSNLVVNAKPATSLSDPNAPGVADASQPTQSEKLDFHQMLPSGQEATVATPTNPATPAAPAKPSPLPGAVSATPSMVLLQAGAFQSRDEAENMRAKLALLGVEATIKSKSLPDKGLIYRVWIGPISDPADLVRLKALLAQNEIPSIVVTPN